MDNTFWSNGFGTDEIIPPVPAPRYKRKLITKEDSKPTNNTENTSMGEQTTNIKPPPRQKNKFLKYKGNNLESKNHTTNKEEIEVEEHNEEDIDYKSSVDVTEICSSQFSVSVAKPDCAENCRLVSDLLHKNTFQNSPLGSPGLEDHLGDFNLDNKLEVDRSVKNVENACSSPFEMAQVFGEFNDFSIFEDLIGNRVLDIPLETNKETVIIKDKLQNQSSTEVCENRKEIRVNSSTSENSATIVGVFYKSDFNSLKNYKFLNQGINNELNTTLGMCSKVDDGNKTIALVPIYDSKKPIDKTNIKDSEEDDSGVYFSDTKSPPHRGNDVEIQVQNFEEESKTTDFGKNLEYFKPFTCDNRDTFDNKTSDDLGPQNYSKMLDGFEAQTVNAFHEEIAGRLSLCSTEINKNKDVENWLNSGEYLSKKKNNGLSEYLRNMLETGSTVETPSLYSLSAVDEEERSDSFSDDIRGSKNVGEIVESKAVLEACTVPSSLSCTQDDSILAPSSNVGYIVENNTVSTCNVNTDCTKVFLNNINISNEFINNDNYFSQFEQITYVDDELNSDYANIHDYVNEMNQKNNVVVFHKLMDKEDHFETNVKPTYPLAPSPKIKQGAVTSLIAYFETIQNQDNILACEGDLEIDTVSFCNYENKDIECNGDELSSLKTYNCKDDLILNPVTNDSGFIAGSDSQLLMNVENGTVADETFDNNSKICDSSSDVKQKCESYPNYHMIKDNVEDVFQKKEKVAEESFQERESTVNAEIASNNIICSLSFDPLEVCDESLKIQIIEDDSVPTLTDTMSAYDKSIVNGEIFDEEIFGNENHLGKDSVNKSIDEFECSQTFKSKEFPASTNSPHKVFGSQVETKDENETDYNEITSTYELIEENENVNLSNMPTRIPVVILSEADVRSSPIGSIELHPLETTPQDPDCSKVKINVSTSETVTSVSSLDEHPEGNDKSMLQNTIGVILEKTWGSVGIRVKDDEQGVVISDVLTGGAADDNGYVFKGFVNIKAMAEEKEIFC